MDSIYDKIFTYKTSPHPYLPPAYPMPFPDYHSLPPEPTSPLSIMTKVLYEKLFIGKVKFIYLLAFIFYKKGDTL